MRDPPLPIFPLAGSHLRSTPRRQFSVQSPARTRQPDNLTADLAPATAVDALRDPSNPLRLCLDGASPSEKAFVMRTAVASQSVQRWLDELATWPWPTGGGPAGFRRAVDESRARVAAAGEDDIPDRIPISDAPRYEGRVTDIGHEMERLNVEEIKAHVLHNHIMPLSRPGTPMSDYSSASLSYNRMEDLTAVITAIVVQALPNLSRLSRLLNTWSTRLVVLRQVPSYLDTVEEAEVALGSAWDALAITAAAGPPTTGAGGFATPRTGADRLTTITRDDFQVMRLVLEKKVTRPGRILDYMLDTLEGLDDTIPDEWLDRMEAAERGYGDWVVACDARIREVEWVVEEERASVRTGKKVEEGREPEEHHARAVPLPQDYLGEENADTEEDEEPAGGAQVAEPQLSPSLTVSAYSTSSSAQTDETAVTTPDAESSGDEVAGGVSIREERAAASSAAGGGARLTEKSRAVGVLAPSPCISSAPSVQENGDELQLPPLIAIPHMTKSEGGSPRLSMVALARLKFMELDRAAANPYSPPSLRPKPRALSMTLRDSPSFLIPSIEEDDEEDEDGRPTTPTTPFTDSSYIDGLDESPGGVDSPDKRKPDDVRLQMQISNILDSIPAKFTLQTETPSINLNPPDFNPPRAAAGSGPKQARAETSRRSRSGLSSRASTPGFTLVPAYARNPRPRPKSQQQDIKVYHLSRASGEAPIKLFIRCVGESGERVMVRVGGGWADLGEYLKEYASHHGRRSAGVNGVNGERVEVRDIVPRGASRGPMGSSPPSRPGSSLESPMTPLHVRKTRRSFGAVAGAAALSGLDDPSPSFYPYSSSSSAAAAAAAVARRSAPPRTPIPALGPQDRTPPSNQSTRSRSSSRMSWAEDDSPMLGLAGPMSKPVEMSEENRAWVASVQEKVRLASGERGALGGPPVPLPLPPLPPLPSPERERERERDPRGFGDMGRVGATKRLFRKG